MLWFIVAAALVGTCLLNSASDNERKRQKRLEENYREYQAVSNAEHEQILRNRDESLEQIRQKTAHELWQERQKAMAERKARNCKNFDVLMEEWQGQFDDRTNLLEQIQSTISSIKAANTREQATELRQSSMQVILSEAFETLARQKAYLAYLKRYKKAAEKIFERTGELLEPFQMTLPEYWTYTGKIIGFNRDDLLSIEFEKNIHQNVDCKFFCEDSAEINRLFPNDEIIYCLVEGYDDKTYTNKISCAKGMFIHKLEQSPNIKLEATVKHHEQNEQGYFVGYILDAEGIEVTLRKKNCKDRRSLAPVGSRKFIHIMNFDRRELKWENVIRSL